MKNKVISIKMPIDTDMVKLKKRLTKISKRQGFKTKNGLLTNLINNL